MPEPQGREALRGSRRSSGNPCPEPADTRCPAEKDEETTTPPPPQSHHQACSTNPTAHSHAGPRPHWRLIPM